MSEIVPSKANPYHCCPPSLSNRAALMCSTELAMSQSDVYTPCVVCNQLIHVGQCMIIIERNVEKLHPDGTNEIYDSEALAVLCASCGEKFPSEAIHISFGDQLK